jgi:hypothetical protein
MKTTHEDHKKGGYFQKGCNECAMFLGHAVMKGHLKTIGDIQWTVRADGLSTGI